MKLNSYFTFLRYIRKCFCTGTGGRFRDVLSDLLRRLASSGLRNQEDSDEGLDTSELDTSELISSIESKGILDGGDSSCLDLSLPTIFNPSRYLSFHRSETCLILFSLPDCDWNSDIIKKVPLSEDLKPGSPCSDTSDPKEGTR
jgi:hypothetical protein